VRATILHADLDAFYASVEQMLDPALRDRPIAVGGGVVLAASYEARQFGVQAGMPAWRARSLCPDIRFVGGHYRQYQRLGDQVVDVFFDFTPTVERISIDEAFLDVSGAARLFGTPTEIATAVRQRVLAEIGLPLSVGVARTKHLAKVASQVAKPNGLVVVEPEREREFLDPLPVGLIWGVGPATEARLHQSGIRTIGQLAATDSPMLTHLLGSVNGAKLAALSANVDPRPVEAPRRARSMGAQAALGRERVTRPLIRRTLGYLADRVAGRLRHAGVAGRTVTVRVRFLRLRSVTRSVTLEVPLSATLTLTEIAVELAEQACADHPAEQEITLLAVSVSNLRAQHSVQLSLAGRDLHASRWGVDRSVDAVRDKFGRTAVGYAGVVLSGADRVPEEFRELAEH
jgi:DNA polymerase-4